MREVEVGTRFDLKTGLSDFGLDEVNELIRKGGRVVRIEGAGSIWRNLGSDRRYFAGAAIKVVIEMPGAQSEGR